MKSEPLTNDPIELRTIISEQQKEIRLLREQVQLLKHYRFSTKSEAIHPDQLPLLDQAIEEQRALAATQKASVVVKTNVRQKQPRLGFDPSLPTRRVELDIEDSEKTCERCESELSKIGEEITRKVDYIPAKVEVIEYARAKYACRCCEETVKRADLPEFILPNSFASPRLLTHLIVRKYVDHLPLHRIEQQFRRLGIYLPRSTQCDWALALAEKLRPLYQAMSHIILSGQRIWTDDTVLPLQNDNPQRNKVIQARL